MPRPAASLQPTMAEVSQQIVAIVNLPDQKQKLEQYRSLLQQVLATGSVDSTQTLIDHLLSDEVPLVVSRQVIQALAQDVSKLPSEAHKAISIYTLEKLQPRVVSFEEAVTVLREDLAAVLEEEEDWSRAAQTLAGIDLESGVRQLDPQYKLGKSIKIAMLYLEDDDPVNAEMYIKKASSLIGGSNDPALELKYKTCYARIMDSKRRFLDAAQRYYELSCLQQKDIGGVSIDVDELEHALLQSITCTILAPAGPQRSRMLSALYKDERSPRLPVFGFLEKVFLERILRREEVDAFAKTLQPHQMALLPDGSTVLDRAVVQHNLLSASKLYNNIHIDSLGALLGVAPEKAEGIAADMISEGRLLGIIDQVDQLIRFDDKVEPLLQWDQQILSVCQKVDDILDASVKAGIKIPVA